MCTGQMKQLQQGIGRFEEKGIRGLDISVDCPWPRRAWAEERVIGCTLLSHPKPGAVQEYGMKYEAGFPERTYTVTDGEGIVHVKVEDPISYQPEVEHVLEALEEALRKDSSAIFTAK